MNMKLRGEASLCECRGWSNNCNTDNVVAHIVVNPYPRDARCGCPVCPSCRYKKPCELCPGSCPVCIGVINPGPLDLNSTYVIKSSIIEDARLLKKVFDACKAGNLKDSVDTISNISSFDVEALDDSHRTLLYYACESGNVSLVAFLVDGQNASINAKIKGYDNGTALMKAVECGNMHILNYFISGKQILSTNDKNNKGESILHLAASKSDNFDIFKAVLGITQVTDINDTNSMGLTFLMKACQNRNVDIVKALLDHENIDTNAQDKSGWTAMHYACGSDNADVVKMLLSSQSYPNLRADNNDTCLIIATERGHLRCVNELIQGGSDRIEVNAQRKSDGNSALMIAMQKGYMSITKYLLAHPAINIDLSSSDGTTALMIATQGKKYAQVMMLLDKYPDTNLVDGKGRSAIHLAVENGDHEMLGFLLAKSNLNQQHLDGALILAITKGHDNIVDILLDHDLINVNATDSKLTPALSVAIMRNRNLSFDRLLHHPDTDVNRKDAVGNTALIIACCNGLHSIATKLLQHPKIDTSCTDSSQKTALLWCIVKRHEMVCQLLLERSDIEVNHQDVKKNTALILACKHGHLSIVERLLQHPNIDVKCANDDGYTTLHCSVISGHEKVSQLLLERSDIEVNHQDVKKNTALILACKHGHWSIGERLLQHPNIDVKCANDDGFALCTALKYYNGKGHEKVCQLLLQHPTIDTKCAAGIKSILESDQPGKKVYEKTFKLKRPDDPLNSYPAALQIPENLQLISSDDPTLQLQAAQHFRRLLSIEKSPPIQEVIDSGIVPKLVEFLQKHDNPSLQFESAWALTNIVTGTSEQTDTVVKSGAVPIFIQLLQSPSENIRFQVAWAIGNIAGDSVECRDYVLSLGALQAIVSADHIFIFNEHSRLPTIRKVTWCLSNLCRKKPAPNFQLVRQALPLLARLVNSQDPDTIITDACWALSYLSDGPSDRIAAVLEAGVAPRLVELLQTQHQSVITPALRTIGNIITGDDNQTEILINLNVLPALLLMLDNPKKNIRKETCWTVSNITAGTDMQIQAVIDCGVMRKVIELLETSEYDTQEEACWAVSSATRGTPQQILSITQLGAIPPLCRMLRVADQKIVTIALEAIKNILSKAKAINEETLEEVKRSIEDCGGLVLIVQLQSHERESIFRGSRRIVAQFFK